MTTNATILSHRAWEAVRRAYRRAHGLRARRVAPDGRLLDADGASPVERLAALGRARAHALAESVRWGEPYLLFLAPGVVGWIVPAVRGEALLFGVDGGAVLADRDPATLRDAVQHLVSAGARPRDATRFVDRLPAWPQARSQEAAHLLFRTFYAVSGWKAPRLELNREKAQQQRQIAEEIQRRKLAQDYGNPVDEERMLLALIRAGDRKGARRVLNQLLGAMFLSSPSAVVVKARAIELMGYLARTAVESSPHLEPLLGRTHEWTARLIETRDFEDLAEILRQALDDFMENVYLLGYGPAHAAVRRAMAYLADHFTGRITLAAVAKAAGLSVFRTAHLVKAATGTSTLQHVLRLRVRRAQQLLVETDRPAADIAYETGFGDQSYFIRQFRRLTGTTPSRYRRAAAR